MASPPPPPPCPEAAAAASLQRLPQLALECTMTYLRGADLAAARASCRMLRDAADAAAPRRLSVDLDTPSQRLAELARVARAAGARGGGGGGARGGGAWRVQELRLRGGRVPPSGEALRACGDALARSGVARLALEVTWAGPAVRALAPALSGALAALELCAPRGDAVRVHVPPELWGALDSLPLLHALKLTGYMLVTDTALSGLALLGPRLRDLTLQSIGNFGTGVGFVMSALTSLTRLAFNNTAYSRPIQDEFQGLGACTGLCELQMLRCDMFPAELLAWTTLTRLTSLELDSIYAQTLRAVPRLVATLPRPCRLLLRDTVLDPPLLRALAAGLAGLEELEVKWLALPSDMWLDVKGGPEWPSWWSDIRAMLCERLVFRPCLPRLRCLTAAFGTDDMGVAIDAADPDLPGYHDMLVNDGHGAGIAHFVEDSDAPLEFAPAPLAALFPSLSRVVLGAPCRASERRPKRMAAMMQGRASRELFGGFVVEPSPESWADNVAAGGRVPDVRAYVSGRLLDLEACSVSGDWWCDHTAAACAYASNLELDFSRSGMRLNDVELLTSWWGAQPARTLPRALSRAPALRELCISGVYLEARHLARMLGALPTLRCLEARVWPALDDACLCVLGDTATGLRTLRLLFCQAVTAEGLASLLERRGALLEALDVVGCQRVSRAQAASLQRHGAFGPGAAVLWHDGGASDAHDAAVPSPPRAEALVPWQARHALFEFSRRGAELVASAEDDNPRGRLAPARAAFWIPDPFSALGDAADDAAGPEGRAGLPWE
ncbi:hypothetical protein FOA52_013959 [Chlamydomonas sp. UWO 241]|nr:hypothetical protein FOA52_013959 [Chlamydomonas sp. UWO 241]